MLPRKAAVAVGLALLVLPAGIASAQSSPERAGAPPERRKPAPRTVETSKFLWATINVCDTARFPDTIGIRGSMPGARDGREVMYMRFEVQYFSPRDGRWHRVRNAGDSGFVRVGRARFESRQAGRSFRFAPRGDTVLLRGVVTFEWRSKGEVVRRARKRTTGKRNPSAGSDPRGFSASNCTIRR